MKRVFVGLVILVMFVVPPVVAQNAWPHIGVGATSNFFNGEPMKTLYDRLRPEITLITQIGTAPDVYLLPQLDYATADGLVRVGGNVFVHVFNWGSWDFYTGGGLSPLQVATEDVVKINSQASVMIDFGATRKVYQWKGTDGKDKAIRVGLELRQEISDQIGSTAPIVESPKKLTILKFGILF